MNVFIWIPKYCYLEIIVWMLHVWEWWLGCCLLLLYILITWIKPFSKGGGRSINLLIVTNISSTYLTHMLYSHIFHSATTLLQENFNDNSLATKIRNSINWGWLSSEGGENICSFNYYRLVFLKHCNVRIGR